MTGGRLVLATIAVALAGFMVVLDMTIANVSVPTIAGSLAVSPAQGTWVVTSYSVADAIVVPLTGWLVMRFGTVKLFIVALMAFIVMSLACGLSQSLEMLVAFRILQGIAGAPLLALSQTLLYTTYPRDKIAIGQGVFAMTVIIAPIVGPILGGWISDSYSWPWIFFINAPVGLVAAALVWHLYRDRETEAKRVPVDRVGLALLVVSVGAFQLMLDKGKELDWFGSPFILALAVIAGVGFTMLVAWVLTEERPIVDLRLFARRNYAVGVSSLAIIYGVFFGAVVLIPQWLQTSMGYTAFEAGLATAPNGILAVLLAPVVARLVGRIDVRVFASFAILVFCATFAMRAVWTSQLTFADVAWPQFAQGLAMACFFLPLSQLSLGSLPPDQVAMGAGLQNFVRTACAAFAASLSTTIWDDQTTRHHAELASTLHAGDPAVQSTLATLQGLGMTPMQALAQLDHMVQSEAALLAMRDYFAWSIPVLASLLVLVWWARPVRPGAAPVDAH